MKCASRLKVLNVVQKCKLYECNCQLTYNFSLGLITVAGDSDLFKIK